MKERDEERVEKRKKNGSERRIEKQRDGNARNGRIVEKNRKSRKCRKWLNLKERK